MAALYDSVSRTPRGARALSVARLRYSFLKALYRALEQSNFTQAHLASRLGVRRSAVNQTFKGDGNLRVSTIAEYLHEMGCELMIEVVPLGTSRNQAVEEMERRWHQSHKTITEISAAQDSLPGAYSEDEIEWQQGRGSSRQLTTVFAS